MTHFLKRLFTEKCPTCKDTLQVESGEEFFSRTIKSCPHGHYEKEYHPALETYIETIKS